MKIKTSLILILYLTICFLYTGILFAQRTEKADNSLAQSQLRFDITSLEKIYLDPETILKDPDAFWKNDEAYILVTEWHRRTNYPLDMEKWIKRVEKIRDLPREERENHEQLIAGRNLKEIEKSFFEKAIPHIYSFMPPNTPMLNTTLYFTTEIEASGFQAKGNIVINILNHEKTNTFVHELFHQAYVFVNQKRTDERLENEILENLVFSLINEGMATYVGFKALPDFPYYWGEDYDLLQNSSDLLRLHKNLNNIFQNAESMPEEKLREVSWEIGVTQRAYYVVGAYMALIIDEKLGREELIKTYSAGPLSFIKKYNSICDSNMKIVEFH